MGEYRDHLNRRCFTPDNDEQTLYMNAQYQNRTLSEILEAARTHFNTPDLDLDAIQITAEHIHTECLGYDQYDAGDYTNYLVITRTA